MAVYSLQKVQTIPASPEPVWKFFADPANLPVITPPEMRFRILSSSGPGGLLIYPGQLIEYRLRALPGFWVYWLTEITHVREGSYFVDEQRRGPYRLWHHQHHFREIPGGVEMTDIVHYQVPLGLIGRWANALLVRRQLEVIFRYRYEKVESLFGVLPRG